jgi:hypothetical protein
MFTCIEFALDSTSKKSDNFWHLLGSLILTEILDMLEYNDLQFRLTGIYMCGCWVSKQSTCYEISNCHHINPGAD